MIADQNFYDICFTFFILRLRLRPTTKGRSLSWPNIRLRPKVKIAPTVQHWSTELDHKITSPKGVSEPKPEIGILWTLEFRIQMTGEFFKNLDQNSG